MGRSTAHDELPSSDDPIWNELGAELLKRLETPKTVTQLKKWARDERLEIGRLINALAWLDMRGLVAVEKLGEVEALWKRSEPKVPRVLQPIPERCPRCTGLMKTEPQRVACVQCGHSIYPPASLYEELDCEV